MRGRRAQRHQMALYQHSWADDEAQACWCHRWMHGMRQILAQWVLVLVFFVTHTRVPVRALELAWALLWALARALVQAREQAREQACA